MRSETGHRLSVLPPLTMELWQSIIDFTPNPNRRHTRGRRGKVLTGIADLQADFEIDKQQRARSVVAGKSRDSERIQRVKAKKWSEKGLRHRLNVKKNKRDVVQRGLREESASTREEEPRGSVLSREERLQRRRHYAASRRAKLGMPTTKRSSRNQKKSVASSSRVFVTPLVVAFKRTGKLPSCSVQDIKDGVHDGVDANQLQRMIHAMLVRSGIEENPGPLTCNNCGGKGHKAKDCPSARNQKRLNKNRGPRDQKKEDLLNAAHKDDADKAAGAKIAAKEHAEEEKERNAPEQPKPPLTYRGIAPIGFVARYGGFREEIKSATNLWDWLFFAASCVLATCVWAFSMSVASSRVWIVVLRICLFVVNQVKVFARERKTPMDVVRLILSVIQLPFMLYQFIFRIMSDSLVMAIIDELCLFMQLVLFVELLYPKDWSTDWRVQGQDRYRTRGEDDDYAVKHKLVKSGFITEWHRSQTPVVNEPEGDTLLPTQQKLENVTSPQFVSYRRRVYDIGPDGKVRETRTELVVSTALVKYLRTRITNLLGMEREKCIVELMRYAENQNSIRLPPSNDIDPYPLALNSVHFTVDQMFSSPGCPKAGSACFY